MGHLIDGRWLAQEIGADAKGRFVRQASAFRKRVTADGSSGFQAEPGRYHLYVASACGWSHRALIFHRLKRLESVIAISYAEPFLGADGWTMAPGADPILGKTKLHEIYTAADPTYTGRVTVPVLWDKKTATIVSNESLDIVRSFDSAFNAWGDAKVSLFPERRDAEIQQMIDANYGPVQNGVYRSGFASSQEAYDEAVHPLFARLEALDALLGRQRYLLGNELTAADICLFPTLYRFDAVYYVHFKCSHKQLRDLPNLWGYTRDIYQLPGVAETCRMDEIRGHYYRSHVSINPFRIVPFGPEVDFTTRHGRERFS